MAHQVLARKWRPRTFHEVVGQPHVVKALSNGLDNDRLHHAFLFTGTRGVGKTTLARIFAKSLNCEEGVSSQPCGKCSVCLEVDQGRFVDLIEIDAASRTKVEDTREILDNVQYAPTIGRYKIYLIDEVHMLSNSSFNALLKTLEEPPNHVKFLLATTDPQKLPVTVLSRCLRLQLKRIHHLEIKVQMQKILELEGISYDEKALLLIAQASEGSMRDALSILDQGIAYTASNITFEATKEMLGIIDNQYVYLILQALATQDADQVLAVTQKISEFGLNYSVLLEELITAFHELTLLQINASYSHQDADLKEKYLLLKDQMTAEDLQLYYQIALHGRRDLSLHPSTEMGFEMTLLRMVLFSPNQNVMPHPLAKKKIVQVDQIDQSIKYTDIGEAANNASDRVVTVVESPEIKLLEKNQTDKDLIECDHSNMALKEAPKYDEQACDELSQFNVDRLLVDPAVNNDFDYFGGSQQSNAEELEDSLSDNHIVYIDSKEVPIATNDMIEGKTLEANLASEIAKIVDIPSATTSFHIDSKQAFVLNNNQDWLNIVEQLPLESIARGVSHSLIFKSFDDSLLVLTRHEDERSFNIIDAEQAITIAVSTVLERKIHCQIEYIVGQLVEESLQGRNERIEREKWEVGYSLLINDPVVLFLENECGAELLKKTIKVF